MSVSPSESSSSENYFIDKEELEEKEPEPEPEKQLTKVNSVKNIENYVFENKDVELACQDFLEDIFQVNPKQDDPLTQSLTKIRKISDISKSNLHSSGQNSPNAHSKEELNSNSNFNSNQKNDIQSNSSSNKKQNIILNRKDSDKENDSNLANSQNNLNRNNSVSSSGRGIACRNFVDDLLLNNNILPDEHGDELNKVEKVSKKRIIQNQNPNQEQSQSVKENINVDEKGKENDNNKNNNFEMTSEQAKFLMEHKKEIITIQKNWKTYYDVNRFKLLKSKALILQQFYR
jgi:hypothetical protein